MTRYTPLWLQAGSYPAGVDRRLIDALWPSRGVGNVSASKGGAMTKVAGTMTLQIAPGAMVVPAANGTGAVLCVWDASESITIAPAPGSGLSRNDSIIIQPRGNDLDGGANNDFVFQSVTGSPAASPSWPPLPPGSGTFGGLVIPGGAASLDTATLLDVRPGGLTPMGALNIPMSQSRLASDIDVSIGTAVTAVVSYGVPGRFYLVNWQITLSSAAGDAPNTVGVWTTDGATAASNSAGALSLATGSWGTVSGSFIWPCQPGLVALTLSAYPYFAHVKITAHGPNSAPGATNMTVLDLGTTPPNLG